jgi:hypothetical protein
MIYVILHFDEYHKNFMNAEIVLPCKFLTNRSL